MPENAHDILQGKVFGLASFCAIYLEEGSSSDEDDSGELQGVPSDDDVPRARLEDLSESDFDEDDTERLEDLGRQLRAWLGEEPLPEGVKAKPLRCTLCGVLLLAPGAFKLHINGRKHKKNLEAEKGSDDDEEDGDDNLSAAEGLCFAEDWVPTEREKVETGAESLARLQAALQRERQGEEEKKSSKKPKKKKKYKPKKRGKKNPGPALSDDQKEGERDGDRKRKKTHRIRPGKRERIAYKLEHQKAA